MPEYKLQRELPRISEAGFRYGGVLVLPLTAVSVPPVAESENSETQAEVLSFPAPAPADAAEAKSSPLAFMQSKHAQRIAAVAAAAGLVFAAANPGQGELENAELMADQSSEVAETRAQAPVGKKIIVAKDAGVQIERVAHTKSINKEDQLSNIMAASSGSTTVEGSQGTLSHPVSSPRITSRFGLRPDPWGGYGMVDHVGQDYGYACGTEVYAAAAGVVTQSEWAGHSGNRVSIDHGNGLVTAYSHNTSNKVNVGDTVERGQLVALGGSTGNSTGCHLHFEVLVDGTFVDPRDWLPAE